MEAARRRAECLDALSTAQEYHPPAQPHKKRKNRWDRQHIEMKQTALTCSMKMSACGEPVVSLRRSMLWRRRRRLRRRLPPIPLAMTRRTNLSCRRRCSSVRLAPAPHFRLCQEIYFRDAKSQLEETRYEE